MSNEKDWMDELKDGKAAAEGFSGENPVTSQAKNMESPKISHFSGVFKFFIGEKVYSRIHECKGVVEYSEMTRFITGDQISYKVRFNDPEDVKTEISNIDEQWLDRI